MRIAYIISAYQLPDQLVRLVRRLDTPEACFFIHVDKRTEPSVFNRMSGQLSVCANVSFLERHRCQWGDFGHVRATLKGIEAVLRSSIQFDYVVLLTGQDYPLVDNRTIRDFLVKSAGKSYMSYKPLPTTDLRSGQRVTTYLSSLSDDELNEAVGVYQRLSTEPNRIEFWYFRLSNRFLRIPGRAFERLIPFRRRIPGGLEPFLGRSYWCLHIDLVRYINRFVSDNPSYRRFFEYVRVPDEIFFQTIVANSPLIDRVINSDIMFQQWVAGRKGNLLDETDLERVFASGRLFARKFDTRHAVGILDAMDARVGQETG